MANDASFRVEIDKRVLEQIIQNTPEHVSRFLDKEAELIVNDIVRSFGTGPAGRTYKRTKDGKTHTASAPPGPPAVDSNALRVGMKWEPTGTNERTISDSVEYGVHLEFGTTKMAPRPFMGPAFERERRVFGSHAADEGLVKP